MMTNDDYQHFVCIVAGDNPDDLMKDYDLNKSVEPTIFYKYKDLETVKQTFIKEYQRRVDICTKETQGDIKCHHHHCQA